MFKERRCSSGHETDACSQGGRGAGALVEEDSGHLRRWGRGQARAGGGGLAGRCGVVLGR